MSARQVRLAETFDAVAGPLARLGRSLREDGEAIARPEQAKSGHALLATNAFLHRFQQVIDLILRKIVAAAARGAGRQRHPPSPRRHARPARRYQVQSDVAWWIELNEARNRLAHEYAMGDAARAAEIAPIWQAAERLQAEVVRIEADRSLGAWLRPGASGGVDPGEADDQ